MNKKQQRALKKLSVRFDNKSYCGCLTYSDLLVLVDLGFNLEDTNNTTVEYAKKQIKAGISHTNWCYFKPPTDKLLELIRGCK